MSNNSEYQKRWRGKHPEEYAAMRKKYNQSEKGKSAQKRFRKKHPYKTWTQTRKDRVNARTQKRRNAIVGRVCMNCNRSDSVVIWSSSTDLCSACGRMGYRNGWCGIQNCRHPLSKFVGNGRGVDGQDTVCVEHGIVIGVDVRPK